MFELLTTCCVLSEWQETRLLTRAQSIKHNFGQWLDLGQTCRSSSARSRRGDSVNRSPPVMNPVTNQTLPTHMNLISGTTRLLCARHASLSCKHWPYPLKPLSIIELFQGQLTFDIDTTQALIHHLFDS